LLSATTSKRPTFTSRFTRIFTAYSELSRTSEVKLLWPQTVRIRTSCSRDCIISPTNQVGMLLSFAKTRKQLTM
jgi:hypothetical protein